VRDQQHETDEIEYSHEFTGDRQKLHNHEHPSLHCCSSCSVAALARFLHNYNSSKFYTRCSQKRQTSLPVTPPGELYETYESSLKLGPIPSITWKDDVIYLPKKPEVHNLSHCRQKKTQPRPQVTCAENFVKFRRVVLRYARGQTDRQTYKQNILTYRRVDHNTSK